MVGLPAAGKTHRARELESELAALRFSPDEFMIPLFGDPEAGEKRYVVEGRLIWVARQALALGVSVILDFGVWVRAERMALRHLAQTGGAEFRMVFLPVERAVQLQRLVQRSGTDGTTTFAITEAELDRCHAMFEAPAPDELESDGIDPPPTRWDSWDDWIAWRWPSSFLGAAASERD